MSFAMVFRSHKILFLRVWMAAENVPTSGSEWCRQLPYLTTVSYILIFLASATKRLTDKDKIFEDGNLIKALGRSRAQRQNFHGCRSC